MNPPTPAPHPNLERALASKPPEYESLWRGTYRARPWLLDLTDTCPRCGSPPFTGCTTPTGYGAKPHAVRAGA